MLPKQQNKMSASKPQELNFFTLMEEMKETNF